MPSVKLPTGLKGLKASPKRQNELRNLVYLREGRLVLRPCVSNLIELDGACRGMGIFRNGKTGDEELYGVFGGFLYKIVISDPIAGKDLNAGNITATQIGAIANVNDCELVASFTYLVVLTKGSIAYAYDGTTLTQITDPAYLPSVSVAEDEGRFIFVPADGSPFFWSNQDDPLAYNNGGFADGEQFPDPNKANCMMRGIHYVLGSRSVESSQYDPSLNTYPRLSEDAAQVGYVAGKTRFGENYAFLGQNSQGGFEFYELSTSPQKISTDTVSEVLNTEYYLKELVNNVTASSFIWKGTQILVFNLPRHTFVYYGDWAYWQTDITGQERSTWRVNHVQYAYGYLWTGDEEDGSLGNLVDESLEFGSQVEWLLSGFVVAEPQTNFPIKYLYATMTEGFDTDARIAFSASKDGVVFGREHYKTLGAQGHYNNQVRWGAPIGTFPDTFCWRLRGYGAKLVNFDGVSYA